MPTTNICLRPNEVAEARRDDEADRERQRVGREDPLQGALTAAEVGADRRAGEVGDGRVEQVHDVGDDHDRKDVPAVAVAPRWAAVSMAVSFGISNGVRKVRTPF